MGHDATPLYAVGGRKADNNYQKLLEYLMSEDDGFNGSAEDFESRLNKYTANKGKPGNNISDDGNRGTDYKTDSVHSEQQASDGKGINGGSTENSNRDINYSLKTLDNRASSEIMTEIIDTVEDLQKGKNNAAGKLSKYVDNGIITSKYYNELVEKYGAIPKGEMPHRDVQVPKNSSNGKKVSQTVRTILEAKVTPDEAIPTIEKMVEDGVFSYDEYSDKQAIEKVESDIKEYGWTKSLNDWLKDVENGVVSKQHTAM